MRPANRAGIPTIEATAQPTANAVRTYRQANFVTGDIAMTVSLKPGAIKK
ncbi:MAG TPA: hypothetical protein VFZ40_09440 [Pyrinomonadaceae bacterium]